MHYHYISKRVEIPLDNDSHILKRHKSNWKCEQCIACPCWLTLRNMSVYFEPQEIDRKKRLKERKENKRDVNCEVWGVIERRVINLDTLQFCNFINIYYFLIYFFLSHHIYNHYIHIFFSFLSLSHYLIGVMDVKNHFCRKQ